MKKDGMMVRFCNNLQVQIALFKFGVSSSLLASLSGDRRFWPLLAAVRQLLLSYGCSFNLSVMCGQY